MVLFATPDFGASGIIVLFVLAGGAIILLLAVLGVAIGMRMHSRGSRAGRPLALFSLIFPVVCFFAPELIFRLEYGHFPLGTYPNGKISEGMTPDQVATILGTPQERFQLNGTERWYYYIDSFGANWFGVDFGTDGRVRNTYGN